MTDPAVLWPTLLGVVFLVAGIFTYGRDLFAARSREAFRLVILGPVFIAASLAAFAGEHFTAARSLAQLVPRWMPGRLFIAYFVGGAHLAAALSFVARRCVRWASIFLALMFALFVLLMDLPAALHHPAILMTWVLAVRQTTFAMGALALFALAVRDLRPTSSKNLAFLARIWISFVLVFYGIAHLLHPEFTPGVPSPKVTATWVPLPLLLAYITGIVLIAFGLAMLVKRFAGTAGALAGFLMLLLTLGLYVPQYFLAQSVSQRVTGLNYVFDTLLFCGTLLVITRAILECRATANAQIAAGQN